MIVPEGSKALNPGFDVTPKHLVTGLITERGVCKADQHEIIRMYEKYLN